jgi:peptidoglycan/LPS O-acetylase OafA/YrhL
MDSTTAISYLLIALFAFLFGYSVAKKQGWEFFLGLIVLAVIGFIFNP